MLPAFKSHLRRACVATAVLLSTGLGHAGVLYSSWSSNALPNGNYQLSVSHSGSSFNWSLTVSPWNAEVLGLFVDLGNVTLPAVTLSNSSPAGEVALYAVDAGISDDCGNGCNINGLAVTGLSSDGWELVFRFGTQGWDGIQTFSWTTNDFGLGEAAFGVVAIRSQVLCSGTDLLPADQSTCNGSDKAFGTPDDEGGTTPTGGSVPEPSGLALSLLALLSAGAALRCGRKLRPRPCPVR